MALLTSGSNNPKSKPAFVITSCVLGRVRVSVWDIINPNPYAIILQLKVSQTRYIPIALGCRTPHFRTLKCLCVITSCNRSVLPTRLRFNHWPSRFTPGQLQLQVADPAAIFFYKAITKFKFSVQKCHQ